MNTISLLVVDDHTLFRRGLMALLGQDPRFAVQAEAGDLAQALRCLAQAVPDVILLDNHMPGVRGVEGIPALKEVAPDSRILMLTVSENEDDLADALQAGADLLKTVETEQLCDSIVRVVAGESVVSPQMMGKLVSAFRSRAAASTGAEPATEAAPDPVDERLQSLSGRETEILRLIARGHSNKLIARELDIAETTVKIHVQHLLRKLQLSSRVQAAVYATGRGLV